MHPGGNRPPHRGFELVQLAWGNRPNAIKEAVPPVAWPVGPTLNKGGPMKKFGFATIIAVLFTTALFAADKKEVTIPADDGFSLKGTFYSAGKVGPGLLLLHQCNADRQIYDTLGTMLSVAGYNALTLDFRGFGGSRNAQYKDLAASRDKMPGDVDAAFKFLTSQEQVNKTVIGVVGGSCGVNQAIQAARRHPEIKTLVLLSGGIDAYG